MREAEAYQIGETRQREAQAAVLEAQYKAQARAAEAQAAKVEAEKRAELEAVAKAVKAQIIVDAEAAAERRRIEAQGEAAAIYARLEAEARGQYEMLAKKGEGLKRIVESCGGSQQAFQMLMLEHIDGLSKTAAQAISNIKFDKIVVWGRRRRGRQERDGELPPRHRGRAPADDADDEGHRRRADARVLREARRRGREVRGRRGGERGEEGLTRFARPSSRGAASRPPRVVSKRLLAHLRPAAPFSSPAAAG